MLPAVVAQLRKKAERVMDLFKRWDDDKSGSVEKSEFRRALKHLKIAGSDDEFDMLFDSWDEDACVVVWSLDPQGPLG